MLLTEVGTISQLITTIGFPIVMCGAMAWFIKDNNDKNREQINNLNNNHKEEVMNITETYREEMGQIKEALNNNTIALQKLCAKLGEGAA